MTQTIIKIEAEDLILNNYIDESGDFASGNTLIKVGDNGEQGTATLNFDGTPGTYELTVAYFDEKDGESTMEVEVDGSLIDSWSFDQRLTGTRPNADNFVERTLNQSFTLNANSTVVLRGLRNDGERARMDYIKLHSLETQPENTDPDAVNDNYNILENNTLNINSTAGVLSNDSDADGDSLTISNFDNNSTEGGSVSVNNNGSFSYTPATNFVGTDSFNYTVSDSNGGTDTAKVTINVTADNPPNDPNQLLQGTNGNDSINGFGGNDTINGLGGNDSLIGGNDNDIVNGDGGNDILKGGNGNDTVDGGTGNDRVLGNNGNDFLTGGEGNDRVIGQSGDDVIVGVNSSSNTPGLGEVDIFTGGANADTFVLGDGTKAFYDDGIVVTRGNTDRAVIQDFNKASGDTIQLHGVSGDYSLRTVPNSNPKHTQILYKGELIGIVKNVTDLDLNGSEFQYEQDDIDNTAPQANLTVSNITDAGGGLHVFEVTYSDNEAVDISTFDANDIFVTYPDGFDAEATFLGANLNSNGTPVTASYQVDAPGGSWDNTDNGTYTVVLRNNEVSDTANNFISGETLGSFQVDVDQPVVDTTAPTTALTASNITNAGGNVYQFNVTYSDDTAVDNSTIDNQDVRVNGPGGFNQAATLVNTVTNNQGAVITATYEINAAGGSWDTADHGSYTISLQDNQVSDTNGNFISGSNLGNFAVNISNSDDTVGQYDIFEQSFSDAGSYSNPYTAVTATATFTGPNNQTATIPLFWDGGDNWKFRFAPETQGEWSWTIDSNDNGLDGESGTFNVVASNNTGGIEAKPDSPYYFQYEDGTPFYFFGDTNWRLGQTLDSEDLDHDTALEYLDIRASQGFNYIHTNFAYDPNEGGELWDGTDGRDLNPGYFQELDRRIEYMNDLGITTGYMLEWAQGWKNDFSSQADRLQYAEYVTARYSAHNVVFIVSGEYNETLSEGVYREIGETIEATDPHDRMITIHSTSSVERFADESWMGFGDYQQIYGNLHDRILQARDNDKPVVNSEYAYYLRDSNGDGEVDKRNSATLEEIRDASYDIVMAGGHLVTGWGTTYFGGYRDPGPFNPNDPRNDDWEEDVQHIKTLFTDREWWKLEPHDELIGGPGTEYLLADIGEEYVAYVRGNSGDYSLDLGTNQTETYNIQQFDPREGTYTNVGSYTGNDTITLSPPNSDDWVYVVEAV
jgi:Ca2+-binding RTX toxin-like protein